MLNRRWLDIAGTLVAKLLGARSVSLVVLLIASIALMSWALYGCSPAATPTATSVPVPTAAPAVTATPLPPATAKPAPTTPPTPIPPTATPAPAFIDYVVEEGDNLHTIAAQFEVTGEAILKANNIDDPDKLFIGQKLKIPKKP